MEFTGFNAERKIYLLFQKQILEMRKINMRPSELMLNGSGFREKPGKGNHYCKLNRS